MTNYLSLVDSGRFEELFEELGWGFVPRGVQPVTVDFEGGRSLTAHPVADQSGLRVWVVESAKLPAPTEQRLVDAAVNKVSQVRLIIFTDGKNQSWRWPRRGATAATNTKLLHHHYEVGNEELGADLARRLEMIELPIGEKIGILEIQERMATAFNDEAVKRSHEASGHMRVMNQQLLDAGCTTEASSSLLVRLLFLFFGDDTNMWPDDAFKKWVLHHTTAESIHEKLTELFEVLCDPELDKALDRKGRYADTEYKDFRRIDGMYKERIELPPLTEDFRQQVLKACDFDWGKVNPDIFGAMFQQLVDLEELRKNGEHYTSEENIMKVIEPMFLDEYRAKFENIYNDRKKLLALQDELATLKFLDPACGCGNFLIQAYKHLRGLEYEIIVRAEELEVAEINAELDEKTGQRDSERKRALRQRLQEIESGGFINFGEDALRKSKLSMRQFHGIEINDWPAKVASTAMLLVDHLCNQVWGHSVVRLPIEETPEVRCANSLRLDWNDVVSEPSGKIFIFGNPPFIGYDDRSPEQFEDLTNVWETQKIGRLDYVTAWFKKSADFLNEKVGEFAFVATSSVTQGEPVAAMFTPLLQQQWKIKFAYQSFVWEVKGIKNEAKVHCVIIGFTQEELEASLLFKKIKNSKEFEAKRTSLGINPYLIEGAPLVVRKTTKLVSRALPPLKNGCVAGDTSKKFKGLPGLVMSPEEAEKLISKSPDTSRFIRRFVGGEDFLKGKFRYCLWIDSQDVAEARRIPEIQERLENVETVRNASTEKSTKKLAEQPWRFKHIAQPESKYLIMPRTVSQDRDYFALGYLSPDTIVSNGSFWAVDPSGLIFAVGSSSMFLAWQLAVGGKLKSDPRFANTLVWNTFPMPDLREDEKQRISALGKVILNAREQFKDETLQSLYSRSHMPLELREAHRQLDMAVDDIFGLKGIHEVEERQIKLFSLYQGLTNF